MRGAVEPVAVARDVASSSPSKAASALDMMRYQRVSSECLPLPNGGSSGSGSGASRKPVDAAPRSSKDEHAAGTSAVAADTSRLATFLATTSLEPKPRARTPQPLPRPAPVAPPSPAAAAAKSAAVARDHGHHRRSDFPDPSTQSSIGGGATGSGSAGPDAAVLPKWGQTKRSRARRESPTPASTPSPQRRAPVIKIARRAPTPPVKLAPTPPPRACTLRASSSLQPRSAAGAGDAHHRSTEERVAGGGARAPEKQTPLHNKAEGASGAGKQKQQQKGSGGMEASSSKAAAAAAAAKRPEMPRILTALTRKEKEEDFLAMKGTKLPQRPKKRSKAVEKAVNLITPGMWLSEVTRSKYVVREKKSRKQQLQQQKYRGLKGMETLDSDSD